MVYKSFNSNQLLHTISSNGWDWGATKNINGQSSDTPALVAFGNDLVVVYPDSTSSGKLSSLFFNSSSGWYKSNAINQSTKQMALAVCNGWLIMTYRDSNSPQLWCSRSKNGIDWQDTQPIGNQTCGWRPAIVTNGNSVFMVCVLRFEVIQPKAFD
jgi:hypothetical protein